MWDKLYIYTLMVASCGAWRSTFPLLHGEVGGMSVYKFHDWSMGEEGSLLTTDNKSPQVPIQDMSLVGT